MNRMFHVGAAALLLVLSSILVSAARGQERDGNGGGQPSEFYDPIVRVVEGWTVKVDPELLADDNKKDAEHVLKALANHLQRVVYILPPDRVKALQKISIWIERDGNGRGLVYHPSPNWLEAHGFDRRLAKHVHVPKMGHLLDRHQWAKHPYAIMHELAHAYHDQVLGFDNEEIIDAFKQAKKSKTYESILAHDHNKVNHYALTNHKEYFAESTESYLGVNDFYPFVRAELKVHDPRMFALQQKIWGEIPR